MLTLQSQIEIRAWAPSLVMRMATAGLRRRKRRALLAAEMPDGWRSLAERHLETVLERIPHNEHGLFFDHLKVFGQATQFIGAGGFEVEDRHRVMVAGRAAQMSRNLSFDVWDGLSHVVLFEAEIPYKYHPEPVGGFVMGPTIVMGWQAAHYGISHLDGYDLIIHELAHVLDYRDLEYDGVPTFDRLFHDPAERKRYLVALSEEYRRLLDGGSPSALSDYAKTNRAEFFAVATEMFFERGRDLQRLHPDLFEALSAYYRFNPLGRW